MGQNKSKPQPGDLIEIDQPFHQHWALYIEDGYVIHLTPVKLGAHEVPVFTRMVKKERLKKVVRRNKWRVNNKSDVSPDPLPVEEIMNCEHFVTNLRYGEAVSEQVRKAQIKVGILWLHGVSALLLPPFEKELNETPNKI
uniref:LRAT domain-containing protein n=1 Tax=Catharus ustulatus TaxID=91951 RepID=A0A8C3V9Y0_CATUS